MPKSNIFWFHFPLKKSAPIKKAFEELLKYGVEDISLLENKEEKTITFCGKTTQKDIPSTWSFLDEPIPINFEVNWQEQWELFCPYFNGVLCEIPLSTFIPKEEETVLLNPGPGFGDLSHPTTYLMMNLLGEFAPNEVLIDLGCGSGILGITALKIGAKKVYCLDIDQEALLHTQENALLNNVTNALFIGKTLPVNANPLPHIVCINMTFEEQKQAIASLPVISNMIWLSSGILESQKEAYLTYMKNLGLTCKSSTQKDKWLSFIFE